MRFGRAARLWPALLTGRRTPSGAGSAYVGGVTELPGGVAADRSRRRPWRHSASGRPVRQAQAASRRACRARSGGQWTTPLKNEAQCEACHHQDKCTVDPAVFDQDAARELDNVAREGSATCMSPRLVPGVQERRSTRPPCSLPPGTVISRAGAPRRYRPAGRWSSSAAAKAEETQAGLERRVPGRQWFREAGASVRTGPRVGQG